MKPVRTRFIAAFTQGPLPRITFHRTGSSVCKRIVLAMAASPPKAGTATLYVKAAENGVDIGDCPFSMKANLALHFKKVDTEVQVIDLGNKPGWFTELNSEGSTPTFVAEDSKVIPSSDEIVAYADKVGKEDKILLCNEYNPNWEAASAVVQPVFSSFVSFLKNKRSDDLELRSKLYESLKAVDEHLRKTGGPYLLGSEVSALDCNFGPKIFHILVATKHYKNFEVPAELEFLHKYYNEMSSKPEWAACACTEGTVIWGWSKFF